MSQLRRSGKLATSYQLQVLPSFQFFDPTGTSHPFFELAAILSASVGQNLFEIRENLRQDNKDWTVLYLNRIFCAHFDLVYHTGGWQRVSARRLSDWAQGLYPRSENRMSLV